MIKSKLIELYKTFDSKQLEALRKWANSPIHNRHKDVIKLIDFLIQKPKITARTVQKEKAFKYLYPKRSYDDLRLRHIMTLTVNSMEDFVGFSQQKNEDHEQLFALVDYCNSKQLYTLAAKYFRKLQKEIQSDRISHHRQHLNMYKLQQAMLQQAAPEHRKAYQDQAEKHQLQYLSIQKIKERLKNKLLDQNPQSTKLEAPDFFETLFNALPEDISSLTKIHLQLYELSKEFNAQKIETFLIVYWQQQKILARSENLDIFLLLSQIMTRKSSVDIPLNRLLMQVYQNGLEQKLLMQASVIQKSHYWDMLSLTLVSKGHAAAANFVNKYTELLENEIRADYNRCARAYLLIAKGSFKSALIILKNNNLSAEILILSLQLQLRVHFKNEQFNKLDKKITQLEQLIKKHQKIEPYKALNFCKALRKSANVCRQGKVLGKPLQEALFKQAYTLADKLWLIEQFSVQL